MARTTKAIGGTVTVACAGFQGWEVETYFEATSPTTYRILCFADGEKSRGGRSRVRRPLTWREIGRKAARVQTMWIFGDFRRTITVDSVEPWQREVIVASMIRDQQRHLPDLGFFLQRFSDEDLQDIYDEYGTLLSDLAIEALNDLRIVVEKMSIRARSLRGLRKLSGTDRGDTFAAMTAGLATRHYLQTAAKVLKTGVTPEDQLSADQFADLYSYMPNLTLEQRAGLVAIWLLCVPKPVTAGAGEPDESGILRWLFYEQPEAVFELIHERLAQELAAFTLWLLREAKPHVEFFTTPIVGWDQNTTGRDYHESWADVAKIVEQAARKIGVSIPPDLALPPMPFRDDCVTGLDIRKAVLTKASQAKLKLAETVLERGVDEADWLSTTQLENLRSDSPNLTAKQRAGLFAVWVDSFVKAGWINDRKLEEAGILTWLLGDASRRVFERVRDAGSIELDAFVFWLLKQAKPHTDFFVHPAYGVVQNAYGRAQHKRWAELARAVDEAARIIGIVAPKELQLPAMPYLGATATEDPGDYDKDLPPQMEPMTLEEHSFLVTRAEKEGHLVSVAFNTLAGERVEAVYEMFCWGQPSAAAMERFQWAQRSGPRLILWPSPPLVKGEDSSASAEVVRSGDRKGDNGETRKS